MGRVFLLFIFIYSYFSYLYVERNHINLEGRKEAYIRMYGEKEKVKCECVCDSAFNQNKYYYWR